MRGIVGAVLSVLLVSTAASGQSVALQGSAGPTITDAGRSLAAGVGFDLTPRLTLLFGVEQSHIFSRIRVDQFGGGSAFRGGQFTLGTGELRATILGRDRVSPYVFGGFGAGRSQLNVNEYFPRPATHGARVFFFGGGVQVPLRGGLSVTGDIRMVVGVEGNEGIVAYAPIRAGIAWRF